MSAIKSFYSYQVEQQARDLENEQLIKQAFGPDAVMVLPELDAWPEPEKHRPGCLSGFVATLAINKTQGDATVGLSSISGRLWRGDENVEACPGCLHKKVFTIARYFEDALDSYQLVALPAMSESEARRLRGMWRKRKADGGEYPSHVWSIPQEGGQRVLIHTQADDGEPLPATRKALFEFFHPLVENMPANGRIGSPRGYVSNFTLNKGDGRNKQAEAAGDEIVKLQEWSDKASIGKAANTLDIEQGKSGNGSADMHPREYARRMDKAAIVRYGRDSNGLGFDEFCELADEHIGEYHPPLTEDLWEWIAEFNEASDEEKTAESAEEVTLKGHSKPIGLLDMSAKRYETAQDSKKTAHSPPENSGFYADSHTRQRDKSDKYLTAWLEG